MTTWRRQPIVRDRGRMMMIMRKALFLKEVVANRENCEELGLGWLGSVLAATGRSNTSQISCQHILTQSQQEKHYHIITLSTLRPALHPAGNHRPHKLSVGFGALNVHMLWCGVGWYVALRASKHWNMTHPQPAHCVVNGTHC